MPIKVCSSCKESKELTDFYQRKSGMRSGEFYEWCTQCYKKKGRTYYHQNHERQLFLAKSRKQKYIQERIQFINSLKKNKYSDCGKIYPPWVMDFDHRDGEVKVGSISNLSRWKTTNLERIKAEIAKCDLVCSSCHRQRTHERLKKKSLPQ